jgi:uncharacterized protein
MNLRDRLASEMKDAMKQKETMKLSVIRLVRSSITNEDKRHPNPVSDEAVEELIKREAKKRHESIEAFQKGGRPELAEKEEKELEILKSLFPELLSSLSEDQVRSWIKEILASLPEGEKNHIGRIMPLILPRTSGRMDGKVVNIIAREEMER